MQYQAPHYRGKPVLIVGHHPTATEAAKSYGFDKAVSSFELQITHPELVPLRSWPSPWSNIAEEYRTRRSTYLKELYSVGKVATYPRFDAVFIFGDHDFDGLHDTQVIIDIITAPHGQIGSHASKYQTVPLYMSADDLLWPTRAPLPRLGQGAIREMIASVFESVTGEQLQVTQYGKPRRVNYAFAEQVLARESERLGWKSSAMKTICMVGDNLSTDVLGANAAQGKWVSVHVLSGVGAASSAVRTLSLFDEEGQWLEDHVSKVPDYVAPTLDHFVREMEHFGEEVVTTNRDTRLREAASLPRCPADLHHVFHFPMMNR